MADVVAAAPGDASSAVTGVESPGHSHPLRAMLLLGGGSGVAIVLGLVQAKVVALLIGPEGVGELALLQSLVTLAAMVAGVGLATGVVRVIGDAATVGEHARVAAVQRAAGWTGAAGVAVVGAFLLAAAQFVARVMLGPAAGATDIACAVLAVAATVAAGVYTGVLNAYHRVRTLSLGSVVTSVLATAGTIAVVLWRGVAGVPLAVVLTALATLGVAYALAPREPRRLAPESATRDAAGALVRFGVPFTASQLVGAGVQLVLPAVVLHRLGREAVGQYRAAAAISTAYLALLVAAFAKDYYPRVAAARRDAGRLRTLLREQQRLVLLIAAPLCVTFLAVAPVLVPTVYSDRFGPAVDILRWQAIGELLKFAAFSGAHVVLARSSSRLYFAMEFVAGATLLAGSWVGVQLLGLPGLGAAYLATYAVYFVTCAVVTRREIGGATSPANARRLAAALGAALAVAATRWVLPPAARLPVSLLIAGCVCAEAAFALLGTAELRRHALAAVGRMRPAHR